MRTADNKFILKSRFKPAGDQPKAIEAIANGLENRLREQTLLGVTGSGKTFTMANVIERAQKPTLVITHNKTLAAQLYSEFKEFFPDNAVHYFVSYYDYYQPEAYIPQTDTYIEKESTINEEIDRLRHASTQALLTRRDVIIVASVSCIYGIGEKEDYEILSQTFFRGQEIKRNDLLMQLVRIQYERNDLEFRRGKFRVKGDTIDLFITTGEKIVRIEMLGDKIESIHEMALKGSAGYAKGFSYAESEPKEEITILPGKHFMAQEIKIRNAMESIRAELDATLKELKSRDKTAEAYKLERRTSYDLEMIEAIGYCNGIENYSRHFTGRKPGEPPSTLIDFFPSDYLLFIDESHVSLPQIRGMYEGDRSRKQTLIDFGFRLPSALDNRPLNFKEFKGKINQAIYVSATPQKFEIEHSSRIVEQIIRPTGLLDPIVEVRPSENQVKDLLGEIRKIAAKGQRILATTLTKRMAEDLSEYLREQGIRVHYLHSEIDTLERVDILNDLRKGRYDVLIGINLLREGLDLPEVSLVAILDADMSGFLRNETSLMQTMGRASRHIDGRVIMYADRKTPAIEYALKETRRRRKLQEKYNKSHGISPKTIEKKLSHRPLG